ncbi:hypothetical protein PHLCEN_2v8782 [Hermanssonia centrifuga]|uniref:RRP15-like protein n=1 Tax=Hermanssonia centrifuga TaxID=98765 RepID=A0A2R6NSH0_9APHY|nr:hypothetical protein PHLCEN_2v8782 [Hermanssonia centrifuga]
MTFVKRQKLSGADESGSSSSQESESDAPDTSTEDDMANVVRPKSKKTLKRKRRATDAINFGTTLQTLLSTDAPSTQPLSLKPSVARKRNEEKLEAKGKKVLLVERKVKEEKGRIKDVIGGWGGEGERALRKVAQRGVVKLFNVIQQSQASSAAAEEGLKSQRGSGRPTLPAPSLQTGKKNGKQKDNPIGRGKDNLVGEDDFLNSIRSGGLVSKM